MQYPHLFSPLKVGRCVFPNRIMATAAVTRLASEDGHVTEGLTHRYQRMAAGGLGAMVVEAAVVLPSRSSYNLRISDDSFVPELREFVERVRTANPDVKIGLQLIHFLKLSRSGWRQKVEDLKAEEIRAIPVQFAHAATRARSAGFDFVEIHMAHFTTLASFLSLVNMRPDLYGGDFEGRVKLPVEVVQATRSAVGDDYTVGMRMNGEEFVKGGNTLLQSRRIARRLAGHGVDYISVSAGERFEDAAPPPEGSPPFAGTGYSGYRMSPRWWHPDGVQVYLAEGVRKAIRDAGYSTPVVTAGKIRTPEVAEEVLVGHKADVIGMARTLLCDPDWPLKAKQGRAVDIVLCAACGYCSEADERYEKVRCIQWPKESLNAPSPWLLAPPCSAACPAGLDVRGYIDCLSQGRYDEAMELIEDRIPLPGVVARVCPRFCEARCNRACIEEPIAINALKRFVVDRVRAKGKSDKPAPPRAFGKVAVVGSGPAGLSAAYYLRKMGYGVTVFEAAAEAGGMLAMGIPRYRLPREVLKEDVDGIRDAGVEIMLNTRVGQGDTTLEKLRQRGYQAFFIAVGAHKAGRLGIPSENAEGVVEGVSWLREVNTGADAQVGERVVVVGGGNVAVDCARTALRLGAKEVTVAYRRSVNEMPAISQDVEEAQREGIRFQFLSSPCQIVCEDEACRGLECRLTELGDPDESGRRRPLPVEGSEFLLEADMVISAVGEEPDLAFLEGTGIALTPDSTVEVDPATLATSLEGVFAGGDAVTGAATVIEAIASGRKAAFFMHRYLQGEAPMILEGPPDVIRFESLDVSGVKKRARRRVPCLSPGKRKRNFIEVDRGFDELNALSEADRCLQCGMFPRK